MVPRLWSQGLREDVGNLLFRVNVLDVDEGVFEDVVGTGKVNFMSSGNVSQFGTALLLDNFDSRLVVLQNPRRTSRFKIRHHSCRVGRASENKL